MGGDQFEQIIRMAGDLEAHQDTMRKLTRTLQEKNLLPKGFEATNYIAYVRPNTAIARTRKTETSNWRRQIPNHQIRIRWGYLPDPQNSGGILKLDKDTMGFF